MVDSKDIIVANPICGNLVCLQEIRGISVRAEEHEKWSNEKFDFVDEKFRFSDRQRETAKQEMDHRLDNMNHLQRQLNLQSGINISVKEKVDKLEIRFDIVEKELNSMNITYGGRVGGDKWKDAIVLSFVAFMSGLIATGVFALFHYLVKF